MHYLFSFFVLYCRNKFIIICELLFLPGLHILKIFFGRVLLIYAWNYSRKKYSSNFYKKINDTSKYACTVMCYMKSLVFRESKGEFGTHYSKSLKTKTRIMRLSNDSSVHQHYISSQHYVEVNYSHSSRKLCRRKCHPTLFPISHIPASFLLFVPCQSAIREVTYRIVTRHTCRELEAGRRAVIPLVEVEWHWVPQTMTGNRSNVVDQYRRPVSLHGSGGLRLTPIRSSRACRRVWYWWGPSRCGMLHVE